MAKDDDERLLTASANGDDVTGRNIGDFAPHGDVSPRGRRHRLRRTRGSPIGISLATCAKDG